ncbi:MAG: alanine--glyoxylate aminotransferase family protein [Candidatus Dormibacteraeota bacterium]|nr:alanine--glyoxylate aminotransferase family protein [Candidatus Dormibacteraeota bacterium]
MTRPPLSQDNSMLEQQLRVPGPTPLPERVVRSASRPMINHRGPEFAALLDDITAGLRWALRTDNDVLIFPASGTGGLEAAVVNTCSPGERALFCTVGSFGDRWAAVGEAYGVDVVRLAMPPGEAVDPEDVERILAENPDITSVFITHNETSTGVTNDIRALAAVVKSRGKLLCVDSVSGAGCIPLETDAWGIDIAVTGSQKGWMAPPGVAMVAVSSAAYERSQTARCPRFYFDFAREKKYQDKKQTFTTPAVAVLYAMQEGLAIMREEGLEAVWARHARVGRMVRAGVEAVGLKLLAAEGHRSDTVTAVHSPADSPEALKELLTVLRTQYGLVLAGGQDSLTGKIFRIGHLGMIDDADVYTILCTLEQGLVDVGLRSRVGLAAAAAQSASRAREAEPEPAQVR